MTIQEMHYDFKFKVDKVDSFQKEDLNVAEVDWLLNEAQLVFLKTRLSRNNPQQTSFEETQKRTDDLVSMVVRYPSQPALSITSTSPTLVTVDLSKLKYPYYTILRAEATASLPNCGITTVPLKPTQHDDLNVALRDPFSKPSPSQFIYLLGWDSKPLMYIYKLPSSTIENVIVDYIKIPRQMFYGGYQYIDGNITTTTHCEFPQHTHSEIVDIAVAIASGIIEHPEYLSIKTNKLSTLSE